LKLNKVPVIVACLFFGGVCWAIDLEPAKKTVIASFQIGIGNGSLELKMGEPYEPEAPAQVLMSPSGDTLILDFYQGVVLYDSKLVFKGVLPAPGYNRIAFSDSILLAWNSTSSISEISVWPVLKTGYGTLISSRSPNGDIDEVLVRGSIIFYSYFPKDVKAVMLQSGKINVVMEKDISKLAEAYGFSISDNKYYDNKLGIITESAESFFIITTKQELVFAQAGSKKDPVNIAMGSIFATDQIGYRYICYMQDGRGRIAIADKEGHLLKVYDLLVGATQVTKLSIPCLAPDGSIRYLESTKDGHRLISIRKDW
jgi:hypothetical protein